MPTTSDGYIKRRYSPKDEVEANEELHPGWNNDEDLNKVIET